MRDDEIKKAALVETDRGLGRALDQSAMSPNAPPGTGADWFGPRQPLRPIAPPEVAGRVRDFTPGINLTTQTRPEEPVTFAALRALADNCDLVRIIIERRKDQMTRLPWGIRLKHDDQRRPKASALSPATRRLITEVTDFFKRPDPDYSFRQWLRKLLEDLFVIDAPTIYKHRTRGGGLHALTILDGSTVKRVLDEWGRTPQPWPWNGEPFTWLGQRVDWTNLADHGFQISEDGWIWPPAYQQILKGLPAVNYTVADIAYRPLNPRPGHDYGLSPVETVLVTGRIAVARALSQLDYYREGNTPAGLFSLPPSWTPDQVEKFQNYWDNLFVGHLGRRRQMRFIAGDSAKSNYAPLREPPLKNEFDEWLARVVCAAFSYPATAFIHQVNRATAEQHEKQAETEGLEPIKQWAADLFNDVITDHFGGDIEFAWLEEDEVDQAKQAEILARYADSGIMSRNECREQLGLDPDPSPLAGVLAVRTPTGVVPINVAPK